MRGLEEVPAEWRGREWTSREWRRYLSALEVSEEKWGESDRKLSEMLGSHEINVTIKGQKWKMP